MADSDEQIRLANARASQMSECATQGSQSGCKQRFRNDAAADIGDPNAAMKFSGPLKEMQSPPYSGQRPDHGFLLPALSMLGPTPF
jgi:hypothetical protein